MDDYADMRRSFDTTRQVLETMEERRRETFGHADIIHERLLEEVRDFEATLSEHEEIGGSLASFGREVLIRIDEITYNNPYLIIFHGTVDATGARVALVQHATQLNVLFVALPIKGRPEPRRIGYERT